MRVPVAKDDPGLRDVLVLGLEDHGYHVDAVERGDAAFDMLKFYDSAVATIDWCMSGAVASGWKKIGYGRLSREKRSVPSRRRDPVFRGHERDCRRRVPGHRDR